MTRTERIFMRSCAALGVLATIHLWSHIQFHGILQLSNVPDLNLSEAFYQFFSEATNYAIGGRTMIQETGNPASRINVHSNYSHQGGEEIPLDFKLKMWALADRELLWEEEKQSLLQANASLKGHLFKKTTSAETVELTNSEN